MFDKRRSFSYSQVTKGLKQKYQRYRPTSVFLSYRLIVVILIIQLYMDLGCSMYSRKNII